MEYVTEQLDRQTGDLVLHSLGDWITVTELGEKMGVGARRVRAVLHHMGILRPEGPHRRFRLCPEAVAMGYGKRHDRPKKGRYPFDVISPAGQAVIEAAWADTVADYEADIRGEKIVSEARDALDRFEAMRGQSLTTREAVSWLRYHCPMMSNRQISRALDVSEQLVGRLVQRMTPWPEPVNLRR
jgi:hypothetical protein